MKDSLVRCLRQILRTFVAQGPLLALQDYLRLVLLDPDFDYVQEVSRPR